MADDETLQMLREIQKKYCDNVIQLDTILDTKSVMENMALVDKAMELEHKELRMREELKRQKFEAEKFKYQQKQDAQNAIDQRKRTWIENIAGIGQSVTAFTHDCVLEMMVINDGLTREQFSPISSRTLRNCIDRFIRPKHR